MITLNPDTLFENQVSEFNKLANVDFVHEPNEELTYYYVYTAPNGITYELFYWGFLVKFPDRNFSSFIKMYYDSTEMYKSYQDIVREVKEYIK